MEVLPSRRHPPELPKLDELSHDQQGSTTSPASVQALLTKIIIERQNDELQPFYSIRAVAHHFHVPPASDEPQPESNKKVATHHSATFLLDSVCGSSLSCSASN